MSEKKEKTVRDQEKLQSKQAAENSKNDVLKIVEGVPGAEKLSELIERGKKKGNLSSTELMDVLEELDLGSEQLGSNSVRHVRGETIQNIFDAYLIDVDGGCVTLVTSTTAETEAHRARLTASLETLEIQ